MFQTYDVFKLVRPLEDSTVPVGATGVVLMVHGGTPCRYEVEFPDGNGGNRGQSITYTLTEEFMANADDSAKNH